MGKPTGFIEIARQTSLELPPEERIQNFNEFHVPLEQCEVFSLFRDARKFNTKIVFE